MTDAEPSLHRVADGVARLLGFAQPRLADLTISEVARVFGGNARRAWACEATWSESDGGRGAESLILLVRSAGSQVQADPEWEFRVLDALVGQGVRAPRLWAHDPAGTIFGGSAVLLTRLPGGADALTYLRADEVVGRARTLDLARAAAELHAADVGALTEEGDPIAASLARWRAQFESARLEPLPGLGFLYDWLADHRPTPGRLTLVHGDFRPGNVLYSDDRIVALLDWEMAHVGDGVEDLAWAYRALWSPERFVSLPEFVQAYERAGGPSVSEDSLRWHRVFSEVKFATISLQAARSVVDGASSNLRLIDRARTVLPAIELSMAWIAAGSSGGRAEAGRAVSAC